MTAGPADRAADVLQSFLGRISGHPWFAAVGEPLSSPERTVAERYLSALGCAALPVRPVAGWAEAASLAQDPGWDRDWWAREDAERQRLLDAAIPAFGEDETLAALTAVTNRATAVVLGAASVSAARAGIADPYLARVAAGAATQAAYQGALATLAGAGPGHAFALKFDLFGGGRWALGIVARGFHVF